MKTVTRELVQELIDFAPTEEAKSRGFAGYQLDGATALFNMLARNRVAYLADEVGMGKTYVALAVLGLLRWQKPNARVVVIAPRENIQRKWIKELRNFVRVNWRVVGNRMKSVQGGPAWEPVACGSLLDFAHEALLQPDRDFFLRMTSFSLLSKQSADRKRFRQRLRGLAPWLSTPGLRSSNPDTFLEGAGVALNALLPDADLVIVDEAHNLKHGLEGRTSIRNRILSLAFGHPGGPGDGLHWYRPKATRVLFLSATPFEEDYAALQRQLDIFGFGGAKLGTADGEEPVRVSELSNSSVSFERKKQIVSRLMVRRVGGLRIAGRKYTKNMYRREWRAGGLTNHDEPLNVTDPTQRLVVALIQKKVAEVLQDERFGNSFQVGMLSSFESFLETVAGSARRKKDDAGKVDGEESDEATFDGSDQTEDVAEKEGVDSAAIATIVASHREKFGRGLPHPKLDAAAKNLRRCFDSGEKSLVFVRRVATVGELASRLERHFDTWLRERIRSALPESMHDDFAGIWKRYEQDRRRESPRRVATSDDREDLIDGRFAEEEDAGGSETFFSWFFRGEGPPGTLSGAAFQKNRLSGQGSAYSVLFEDDHVSWLLGRPEDPLEKLSSTLKRTVDDVTEELRARAWSHFRARTSRAVGYPRILVFDSYQAAALEMLEASSSEYADDAAVILEEWQREVPDPVGDVPSGFPDPRVSIGGTTFFTELVRDEALREALWPDDGVGDFRASFRRREQRRQLLSAVSRLGLAYIDLYLLAIRPLGSFALDGGTDVEAPEVDLARVFVAELLRQRESGEALGSYRELADAAQSFDLLVAVNFPEVPRASLPSLAEIYGRTLQRQVPVGRMAGGVNKRLVRQFRMPGFPLVMVSTSVLQEGEDLHTFCKNVMHYGITWTPSGMEQRTGRVDRIGSLAQRGLDGRSDEPEPHELIQVFYPHLRDTVEVLQVRRVLRRMNRFLELIHDDLQAQPQLESRVDAARAILEEAEDVPPILDELRSAFPVSDPWLEGELHRTAGSSVDADALEAHLNQMWSQLCDTWAVSSVSRANRLSRDGVAHMREGRLLSRGESGSAESVEHRFRLELRSHPNASRTLIRCSVDVGRWDVDDDEVAGRLSDIQAHLGLPRICAERDAGRQEEVVTLASDLLFDPATTQFAEIEWLVARAVERAEEIRSGMRDFDRPLPRLASLHASELGARVDALIELSDLDWERDGDTLDVGLWPDGRDQRVRLRRRGEAARISSVVMTAGKVGSRASQRCDAARRSWFRNRMGDLVSFGVDRKGRVLGRIEQPMATLDDEELELYVETVARECDRFEYVLLGTST